MTTITADTAKTTAADTGFIAIPEKTARLLATAGGVLTVLSCFLSWTWTAAFPGDLTVYGYPGGLQWLVLIGGALTTLFGLASYGVKGLRWLAPAGADAALKLAALAAFATAWYTVISITVTLGGVVNLEPGGYLVALVTLLALTGALALPFERPALDAPDPDDTPGNSASTTSATPGRPSRPPSPPTPRAPPGPSRPGPRSC